MHYSRCTFLRTTQSFAIGVMGLKTLSLSGKASLSHPGYGQLIKDKNKILDLPKGFYYKIIEKS